MEFAEIYDKYSNMVYGYLSQRLRDQYLIEDIFQETFLSLYENMNGIENINNLKSWLLTVAHRRLVDELKKQESNTVPFKPEIENSLTENLPADDIALADALQELEPDKRQILYGIYHLGLSCEELGEIMEIPSGTVKSRAYYARQQLKSELKEE